MSGLSDAEREALWESIERAFLDTTTFDRPSEDAIDATVERIIAARLAEQAERIAGAIEAERAKVDPHGRWSRHAFTAGLTRAAHIARNHGTTP